MTLRNARCNNKDRTQIHTKSILVTSIREMHEVNRIITYKGKEISVQA